MLPRNFNVSVDAVLKWLCRIGSKSELHVFLSRHCAVIGLVYAAETYIHIQLRAVWTSMIECLGCHNGLETVGTRTG